MKKFMARVALNGIALWMIVTGHYNVGNVQHLCDMEIGDVGCEYRD